MALLSGSILTAAHFLQVENPQPHSLQRSVRYRAEIKSLHRRNASRLSLLLFTSFRRALLGDGSLRKLTNVAQGAGTAALHTHSIRLDAREARR